MIDSNMSQLIDGSLVVLVILDVQVAAARQRERRVILVETDRTLFCASCVTEKK